VMFDIEHQAIAVSRAEIADVTIDELALGAPLGDGASGDVFASSFQGAHCMTS
jgi:hypothetical protein